MYDYGFGLIGPRQVHAEYKMQDYIYASTTWCVTSSVPMQYRCYMCSSVAVAAGSCSELQHLNNTRKALNIVQTLGGCNLVHSPPLSYRHIQYEE